MKDTGERLIPKKSNNDVVYGEHMSRYLAVIDLVKSKEVLDVASGSGYGSQLLSKYAKKVTGIDYSETAVKYAKKNYPARNLNYIVGDAENLHKIKNKSVDVVISMETIEHLPNPESFIKEVKRILKDDGIFVVSTPNDNEYREGNEFHIHEFTLKELRNLINKFFFKSEYYYQGNALVSTLFNKFDFENTFRKKMIIDKSISVKSSKAIYFIVVASKADIELPKLTSNVAISQHWNTKGFIEWSQDQDQLIKNLQKNNISFQNRLKQTEEEYSNLELEINRMKNNPIWKMTIKLTRFYRIFRYPRTTIKKLYNLIFR